MRVLLSAWVEACDEAWEGARDAWGEALALALADLADLEEEEEEEEEEADDDDGEGSVHSKVSKGLSAMSFQSRAASILSRASSGGRIDVKDVLSQLKEVEVELQRQQKASREEVGRLERERAEREREAQIQAAEVAESCRKLEVQQRRIEQLEAELKAALAAAKPNPPVAESKGCCG